MKNEECTCSVATVPYAAYESTMEREDRKHKRDFIIKIILIVALIVSNALWIRYENSFEDTVTVTQEGQADGDGNILLNNGGDMNYGIGETNGN
mgnify:CR=1 FL=1